MAPPVKTPRERWINEGLAALADGGPEAVRIEALADRIGVTKGGFYGHFADRNALLDAMLDTWEQTIVEQVIEQLDGDGGDARSRLTQLFTFAAASSDWLRVDLAIRDWARRDHAIATRLARVDDRRMSYLRAQFRDIAPSETDAEARALLAAALWIGSHFFGAGHGDLRREDVIATALEHLLN